MRTTINNLVSLNILSKFIIMIIILFASEISLLNAQEQMKRAAIDLQFIKENGKKAVLAKVNEINNDNSIGKAVEELDIYFYVQRTFSQLPIGNFFNTTDENGEVKIEFPSDLPGDTAGNVKVIAKIEDSYDYLDTEVVKTINWGVPTIIDHSENKRSLWAAGANAPLSLLILVNSLIAAVWGIIFYIIYKLYQISKL